VSGQLYALVALPPGKEPPVTTGQEAGLDPRASLGTIVEERQPNPSHPACSLVTTLTELS
jgi:hypothetical protein